MCAGEGRRESILVRICLEFNSSLGEYLQDVGVLRERPIDYYCLTCHCVLCHKCFLKEHNVHEYLDVECETVKEKATELVLTSEKFIQNKIKDLEETHVMLVESRETLQRFTEDACSRITKQTDKIIADIKASSERIMTDVKNKSQESESKLTKTEEKIMVDIKNFKLNLETNFPSLTEDFDLQILVSFEKIKELEELCKDVKVETPSVVQYLDWKENDFSLITDMLGSMVLKQYDNTKLHESMVLKQYHIPKLHESNSYQFYYNINDIKKDDEVFYSQDKFSYSNLVWNCCVMRYNGYLYIYIGLLPDDNPRLNYCIIDYQISILNIDNKTITNTYSDKRLERGHAGWYLCWAKSITWSKLTDKNNGYLNSNNQFVIQGNITQIREISLK
ncbi:hypothetical protein LOTGIDRAFT_174682 [Lottia gigantea]|uniref:B box-type domain-containing protein n=1 Tax=Lottia gigantea TaxID=225164 RepID=V3ZZ04_LOTGI|nr:hypothetical protein LOTGIDRAFT_174682 [Lottia gigantea]ESO96778.1 hypothetical protein LOTGIDRAFT_174682 [Lottia gigantea]